MQVLTVDIGTGTQDIYLYDSRLDLENGFKLIVPSPTMIVRQRILQATQQREAILLTGVLMGGGPSHWAAEAHLRKGLPLYATPEAAQTFNDDLDIVKKMGVQLVSEEEAHQLSKKVTPIEFRDFDFPAILQALQIFGVTLPDLAAVAVAVFDHGESPPHYSDRQFRFDYLDERIRSQNRLSAFAFRAEVIPLIMTRLRAVAQSAREVDVPLVVMDTAPAAILGATFDPQVANQPRVMVANVGNFHTLAFRLKQSQPGAFDIEGVFEHHTGLLDQPQLETLLEKLADGSLTHEDVFNHHGHGALLYDSNPLPLDFGVFGLAVTGPRRGMLRGSRLRPHFAVPFGDMMITGCFGLLAATADILPELSAPIQASMRGSGGSGTPPWE